MSPVFSWPPLIEIICVSMCDDGGLRFSGMQPVNIASHRKVGLLDWRPAGEREALSMLRYIRSLHQEQLRRGGRSHHEQSSLSRAPSGGRYWPWGISREFELNSVNVNGCSVGLMNEKGTLLLKKAWRIESSSKNLLDCLSPYRCSGNHQHGDGLKCLWRTACYTQLFACLVAEALLNCDD